MVRCTGMAIVPKFGGVPIFLPAHAENKQIRPIKINCLFIILLLQNGLFYLYLKKKKRLKSSVNIEYLKGIIKHGFSSLFNVLKLFQIG